MPVVCFLLGFSLGCLLLIGYIRRVRSQLLEIQKGLAVDPDEFAGSPLMRLQRSVHQQRLALQGLEQQIQTWQNVLRMAPVGYLEVDRFDQFRWINPKAEQLLNPEMSSRPLANNRFLLEVVRSLELEKLIQQVRQSLQPQVLDWTMHLVDPSAPTTERDVQLRGHALPLPNDHVGVFIEDRREATLLTIERDRWASDVAHELKTPLTSIQLMLETLATQIDPSLQTWTERLLNEVLRLSTLVHDLLELSQMSLKPMALRLAAVDLPALIRTAWLNLEPLAQQKDLSLLYEGPEALMVAADQARLYRVFANLIDNGIKHSPAHTAIMVQVRNLASPHRGETPITPAALHSTEDHHWVRIDIIDAGPGFPAGTIDHVFKRFYRADPSRVRSPWAPNAVDLDSIQPAEATQGSGMGAPAPSQGASNAAGSGSGLGLAIVQQIIATHGGTVTALNHPQTGGGWLQVILPRQQP